MKTSDSGVQVSVPSIDTAGIFTKLSGIVTSSLSELSSLESSITSSSTLSGSVGTALNLTNSTGSSLTLKLTRVLPFVSSATIASSFPSSSVQFIFKLNISLPSTMSTLYRPDLYTYLPVLATLADA